MPEVRHASLPSWPRSPAAIDPSSAARAPDWCTHAAAWDAAAVATWVRSQARVSGAGVETVTFRSASRLRQDRARPFGSPVGGRSLRARIQTSDGRVVTLDRTLPRHCR